VINADQFYRQAAGICARVLANLDAGSKIIIYAMSVAAVQKMAQLIGQNGIDILIFHGELDNEAKTDAMGR